MSIKCLTLPHKQIDGFVFGNLFFALDELVIQCSMSLPAKRSAAFLLTLAVLPFVDVWKRI